MSKNLKTLLAEQTRVAADMTPAVSPVPAPPAADDPPPTTPAATVDEDMDDEVPPIQADDEGAPGEGEDDFDVDSFDLADLLGDEGEEGDGSDEGEEGDEAAAGDVNITHDEDTGKLNIEHEPDADGGDEGDSAAAAMDDDGKPVETPPASDVEADDDGDDDDVPMGGEDEEEEDTEGGMRMYDADDGAPPEGDKEEDDQEWAEAKVASAIVDVHLSGGKISPRSALLQNLRKGRHTAGAKFLASLNAKDYSRLAKLMNPLLAEAKRVKTEFDAADTQQSQLVANLTKSGRKEEAAKLQTEYRSARAKDVEAAKLDFVCPPWLSARVAAFRKDKAPTPKTATAATTEVPSADFVVAELTTAFVNQKFPKKAARFLLGVSNPDTREAASVLASLFNAGKKDLAARMVRDLRLAAYSSNPDMKPTNIDPTKPMRPGSRSLTSPPDAGFSYGLGDEDMRKAMTMLAVDDAPSMAWVATLPKDTKGTLDANGRVAVYTDKAGEGPTKEMTFAEAKDFMATKVIRHAAMLVDPSEFTDITEDDVTMTLHAKASESPYWNVLVAGYPVAAVHLSDQADPDTYRSVFVDPDTYAQGLRQGMARFGVKPTLDKVNARYWVSAYHFSKEMEEARSRMVDEESKVVHAAVEKRAGEFVDLMLLAHEGMRKNFLSIDDPLKWALSERLKVAGVRPEAIEAIVEEALNMPLQTRTAKAGEGEPPKKAALSMYLEVLIAKAMEYQKMDRVALEHISKEIVGAPVRYRDSGEVLPESADETLRERLARSSLPLVSVRTWDDAEQLHGRPSVQSSRDALRASLRIGRRYTSEGGDE